MTKGPLIAVLALVCFSGCPAGGPPSLPGHDGGILGPDSSTQGACVSPNLVCGSRCVNPLTDSRNCGTCGEQCARDSYCDNGRCASGCPTDRGTCGESCVDFASDPLHCGGCDRACSDSQVCVGGSCQCPAGSMDCGGVCADRLTSEAHCGSCGNACAQAETCIEGQCAVSRESDCDNGIDEDLDNARDCQDSDCVGHERSCSCPGTPESGTQTCGMDGTFGECRGCPMPDCDASNPCDYGSTCSGGACVFDPTAVYDLEILSVTIPATDASGDSWDYFIGTGNADVYIEITVGSLSGRVPGQGAVEASDSHVANFTSPDSIAIRGETATNLMSMVQLTVYDDDTDWVIGITDWEVIGECSQMMSETDFVGDPMVWECAGTEGLSITYRLREPR